MLKKNKWNFSSFSPSSFIVFSNSLDSEEDNAIIERYDTGITKGQFSIRINDQWRICFIWRDGDAYEVEIADYH